MITEVRGVIDRRILVNYRVKPSALRTVLPDKFEPMTVDGWGVGGICLIRLRDMRPPYLPAFVGVGSENAAHRIAVTWDDDDETGVYVPRRDTSSYLNAVVGDRLFGGEYRHGRFTVEEGDCEYSVEMESRDGTTKVAVQGEVCARLPDESVFDSLEEASEFFRHGSTGYAPAGESATRYRGVELSTDEWRMEPMSVKSTESSYFESPERFPQESVEFDCALLMRDISHEWRRRESICVSETENAPKSVNAAVAQSSGS